jgi:hypothetical protein
MYGKCETQDDAQRRDCHSGTNLLGEARLFFFFALAHLELNLSHQTSLCLHLGVCMPNVATWVRQSVFSLSCPNMQSLANGLAMFTHTLDTKAQSRSPLLGGGCIMPISFDRNDMTCWHQRVGVEFPGRISIDN